ncbi:MAG: hypothetical protein QMC36_01565 [Patescibacteria group bacterium]
MYQVSIPINGRTIVWPKSASNGEAVVNWLATLLKENGILKKSHIPTRMAHDFAKTLLGMQEPGEYLLGLAGIRHKLHIQGQHIAFIKEAKDIQTKMEAVFNSFRSRYGGEFVQAFNDADLKTCPYCHADYVLRVNSKRGK